MDFKFLLGPILQPSPELKRSFRHCLSVLLFFTLLFCVFFSSVLFSGDRLLAPGDGIPLFLPNFYSRKVLWDGLLLCGFPMFADPQVMMWYPPEMLLSHIPGSWNIFIVVVYVLASCFMYGYVYTITGSRLSGLASGIVYSMSGFMTAHLGHTGIIHCAAWLPLIIWSLEMLRRKWNPYWFALGSLAVAFCFLSGHSQIFFYGLILSVCYALTLGWRAPVGRWRYYLYCLLLVALGVGLSAIQIIPTAELAGQSVRTEFSYTDFVSYSLPPYQLVMLIFPTMFGSTNYFLKPYFGAWNLTELTGYVGLLPLVLAAIGVTASGKNRLTLFWLLAGLLALLLALGDATPLARIVYHVPVINRFRAPARHLMEMTFAVSVLAGVGLNLIRQGKVSARHVRIIILASALLMLATLFALWAFRERLSAVAALRGSTPFDALPWTNGSLAVPLLIFVCAALVLAFWSGRPVSFSRTALLIIILLADVASFGWFYEWSYAAPRKSVLVPSARALDYANALSAAHQRLLPVRGLFGPLSTMPPNTSRLWGVPSATGNNVLRLERLSRLLSIFEGGSVDESWSEANNQSVNLMAIRYIVATRGDITKDKSGVTWLDKDLDLWVGEGCNKPAEEKSRSLNFSQPYRATRIGLVSMLACSTHIADGAEAARLSITDTGGRVQTRSLIAGRDASEWSYDCSNIKPQMRHQRATIFNTFPAKMYDVSCEGHHYVTMLSLDEPTDISSISLQWMGGPTGALVIEKISLIDDSTGASNPFNPSSSSSDSSRLRLVEQTDEISVYENLRAMPRVWLAHTVALVKPEEALAAIKTSKLPDGRDFDPKQTALVEESPDTASQEADPNSSAEVAYLSDSVMEVRSFSASPSFLVTSDPYYPGWRVSIDGQPAHLLRADYALRGVRLPAGQHLVRFEFRPRSYYYGVAISAMSLLALILIVSNALAFHVRRRPVLAH